MDIDFHSQVFLPYFLCHGSGGYKFLTNRKKKKGGGQGFRLVETKPTLYQIKPLLAENNFAWLCVVVK